MSSHAAAQCYALRLRVGRQNSLLSPLLVRLYARLRQIPDAAVVAVTRSDAQAASEARALIRLPGYPPAQARNLLVAWAETTIDAINHEQPYSTPGLLERQAGGDTDLYRTLVCCEPTDAAPWLRAHADTHTATALLALSEHLACLLTIDLALLKTALPVAISSVLKAQYPGRSAALSALVFANTPTGPDLAEMLRKREALERGGRLVRRAALPAPALAAFAQLVSALRHGMAITGARGAGFTVIRILLNQLGFAGPESDYLILLALPPKTWWTLHRRRGHGHAI